LKLGEEETMKVRAVFLSLFFVVCLGLAGYIVARVRPVHVSPGFTLYINQTAFPKEKAPILSATKIRYQKADGNWKTETRYANGRLDVGYGQLGLGVVHVDDANQKLDFVSDMTGAARSFTADYLRKQPGFVGEESILGYQAFHLHWEQNGEFSDSYWCPSLPGYPLKLVSRNDRLRTVFEVTKVVPGDPSFGPPPDYELDRARYQQVHPNN
jgi:hypothetical protein